MQSGEFFFTAVIDVKYDLPATAVFVYPNPVTGKTLHLKFEDGAAGSYVIKLVNLAGQTVVKEKVLHNGGDFTRTLMLTGTVPAGVYRMLVTGGSGTTGVTVIIQKSCSIRNSGVPGVSRSPVEIYPRQERMMCIPTAAFAM